MKTNTVIVEGEVFYSLKEVQNKIAEAFALEKIAKVKRGRKPGRKAKVETVVSETPVMAENSETPAETPAKTLKRRGRPPKVKAEVNGVEAVAA